MEDGREGCDVSDETEDKMITGDSIRKRESTEPAEREELALTDGYRILPEEAAFPDGGIIACQGVRGANSQLAADTLFPHGTIMYFKNFGAVARAVSEGMCRFGVLPIENNTYGSVKNVYRILGRREVSIVRSMPQKITHVLLMKKGGKPGMIRKVISHEQALGQCSEFLHSLGDKVEEEACLNTAVAARLVSESDDPGLACISAPECAELYGLNIVKKHIADSDRNYTRFLVVAREPDVYPGANRISMILNLQHKPGALARVLDLFAGAGINMLKIESAPIPGRDFEFSFYIDIEASVRDAHVRQILDKLREECPGFTFLGNYEEVSVGE